MNKCEKCGFLHYRTDPCRKPKESTAARKDVRRQMAQRAQPEMGTPDCTELASRPQASIRESAAGTQALPVDKSRTRKKAIAGEVPSVNEQPEMEGKLVQVQQSGPAPKFDKKSWMRDYMREHRRGIRRRAAK